MGALVDDLLVLARLDQARPLETAPVDLATLADDAARDARAVDPERPIVAEVAGPLVVLGDEQRLRQVLANLVGNALIHTAPGTPVEVTAGRDGSDAVVTVTDWGEGMAPEVAERAFERFYRADPARSRHRGGSGLGLSIVQAVVAAHGGGAAIESRPGQGTRVTVRLPLASDGAR
jgi:two-component system OmpR family sensor kinase